VSQENDAGFLKNNGADEKGRKKDKIATPGAGSAKKAFNEDIFVLRE
jgi:hypothetical protein